MFDTHCHLNFSIFKDNYDQVIDKAIKAGVKYFMVPGTDIVSSNRALELSDKYGNLYAAVGIHPHNVFDFFNDSATHFLSQRTSPSKKRGSRSVKNAFSSSIKKIEKMLSFPKVVAVGEVGLDYHIYQKTKYGNYQIDKEFIELQKEIFIEQIKLASKHNKALIIHNREAKKDLLDILSTNYKLLAANSTVFHCCEPDRELLEYAFSHKIFIGVDGDVTYNIKKSEFIKQVPLDMLVLETDSPYLLPDPLRTEKAFPNEPKNLRIIAEYIAKLHGVSFEDIVDITTKNARKLFGV